MHVKPWSVAHMHTHTLTHSGALCSVRSSMQGYSQAIHHCLIGFMTAAVPSQFLQIGSKLISLSRLLLRIKEDVGGDRS